MERVSSRDSAAALVMGRVPRVIVSVTLLSSASIGGGVLSRVMAASPASEALKIRWRVVDGVIDRNLGGVWSPSGGCKSSAMLLTEIVRDCLRDFACLVACHLRRDLRYGPIAAPMTVSTEPPVRSVNSSTRPNTSPAVFPGFALAPPTPRPRCYHTAASGGLASARSTRRREKAVPSNLCLSLLGTSAR